jgi:RNA polymerase sigma-70 factor (sigma-E family)
MTSPVCTSASTTQFTAYVRTKGSTLLRTARALTPNPADAEDLLQTALTKTYLAWDRIDDHRAVDGYVRRTLVNTRTSQWRKRKVDEFSTDELPETPGTGPDLIEQQAQRDALLRAIARLPPRQRAMVVLRYYEDLSEVQTADRLGVSVGTVKSTVSRALGKLRDDPELVLLHVDGLPGPSEKPRGESYGESYEEPYEAVGGTVTAATEAAAESAAEPTAEAIAEPAAA